jgi:hypothetical protein
MPRLRRSTPLRLERCLPKGRSAQFCRRKQTTRGIQSRKPLVATCKCRGSHYAAMSPNVALACPATTSSGVPRTLTEAAASGRPAWPIGTASAYFRLTFHPSSRSIDLFEAPDTKAICLKSRSVFGPAEPGRRPVPWNPSCRGSRREFEGTGRSPSLDDCLSAGAGSECSTAGCIVMRDQAALLRIEWHRLF